ncbi:MAG: hypothetical protein KC461_08650 [Dehalococcoidia bacterium]|nr:hypothetical protein [Dehalococcoidia bacterium]MCA9850701.1 hypothetical protein [Dehalococcoidia bacterium]MCA9855649.1 hypothetical protein [Dehalococcoidia bacterium]MCB9483663.1 hypothetical protein [Dehalococcoidia bacterium]MCB9491135.1 hypothetical protein [Dehalococcoidia bacterium]
MKLVRIYTGDDGESHVEPMDQSALPFTERDGTRTPVVSAVGVELALRKSGFIDFHPAPRRQYMVYLTARVEIGLGDGTSIVMEPGDVLQAEDTTGRGHTSRILQEGVCMVVRLED